MSNHDRYREQEYTDTIRALKDYAATINYPLVPDIASAVRAHLGQNTRGSGMSPPPLHDAEGETTAIMALPSAHLSDQAPASVRSRPVRQWPRQAAKLLAATAALAIVALLLTLAFAVLSPGSGQSDPPPAGAPAAGSNLLYVLAGDGTISAVDTTDEAVAFSITTSPTAHLVSPDPDAAVSPDGRIVYVIADDSLFAVEAASRTELWRTPLPRGERLRYIGGDGPSTLAVSPDGLRLYLYSSHGPSLYYVRILDAGTGTYISETSTIRQRCAAEMHVSPDGSTLYAVCIRFGTIAVIDLDTLEVLPSELIESGAIAGAVPTSDGRLFIVVNDVETYRVVVLDMDERRVVQEVQLGGPPLPAVLHQLVALSADGGILYVTLGEDDHDGDTGTQVTRRIAVFDTSSWRQTSELVIDVDLGGTGLFVDTQGQLYGISNGDRPDATEEHISYLWKVDPATGEMHIVLERSSSEIAPYLRLLIP